MEPEINTDRVQKAPNDSTGVSFDGAYLVVELGRIDGRFSLPLGRQKGIILQVFGACLPVSKLQNA
jgi:hypothetical protein